MVVVTQEEEEDSLKSLREYRASQVEEDHTRVKAQAGREEKEQEMCSSTVCDGAEGSIIACRAFRLTLNSDADADQDGEK